MYSIDITQEQKFFMQIASLIGNDWRWNFEDVEAFAYRSEYYKYPFYLTVTHGHTTQAVA